MSRSQWRESAISCPISVGREGRKHDFLHPYASLANHFQRPHQRMRGSTSLSRYAATSIRCRTSGSVKQIFDQFERRRIQPLKVVEEQDERVFGPSENTEESPKHQLERRFAC